MSRVFRSIINARARLYESGYLKTHRLDHPVISVGNLTVGGTGIERGHCFLVAVTKTIQLGILETRHNDSQSIGKNLYLPLKQQFARITRRQIFVFWHRRFASTISNFSRDSTAPEARSHSMHVVANVQVFP